MTRDARTPSPARRALARIWRALTVPRSSAPQPPGPGDAAWPPGDTERER